MYLQCLLVTGDWSGMCQAHVAKSKLMFANSKCDLKVSVFKINMC